jgi:hypothetical protein
MAPMYKLFWYIGNVISKGQSQLFVLFEMFTLKKGTLGTKNDLGS